MALVLSLGAAAMLGPLSWHAARRAPTPIMEVSEPAVVPPPRSSEMQAVLDELARQRRRNILLALGSTVAAAGTYVLQRANPADPVKLLERMETESLPLQQALQNGKPTLVEFYAPWCESCKVGARDMMKLERIYGNQVNFVTINGDDPRNAKLVTIFGVDSIPHIALLSRERTLAKTLVGAVPAPILEREIVKLVPSTQESPEH